MLLGNLRAYTASALIVLTAAPAGAQTVGTRADETEREQAEKAGKLQPPRSFWIEKKLLEIEQGGGVALTQGFFVAFGDIKSGASMSAGPLYVKRFDSGAFLATKAGYSIRNFKMAQFFAQARPVARGRLLVNGRARWQDAPGVAVFPLGTDSPDARSEYSETKVEFSGQVLTRPAPFLRFDAGAGYETFETAGPGTPFTPADLPGLDADPEYLHSFARAGIDSTEGPGYSRRGTMLLAAVHDYRQQDEGPYSFQRIDGVARQLIPILRGNWVIDLSIRASTTDVDGDNQVPFFLMPDLGGGSDLRGFGNYRFRDRHSILFTAEYRWYVQEFVDMAIFYDAGKVTSSRNDLDFDNLESDVGIGIRFHSPQTTFVRFELTKGDEGLRFRISFSPTIQWGQH